MCVYICVYIIIKNVCIHICVFGIVVINILVPQLPPSPHKKQKFLAPPLAIYNASLSLLLHLICSVVSRTMGVSETFFFFFFSFLWWAGLVTTRTKPFFSLKKKKIYISVYFLKNKVKIELLVIVYIAQFNLVTFNVRFSTCLHNFYLPNSK